MRYNKLWIPYMPFDYSPSFYRVRLHIKSVLTSLCLNIYHNYENKLPTDKVKNSILVLSLDNNRDPIRQKCLLHSVNRIYYGVTEGPLLNPPSSDFRVIVPSKYVAEECEKINLKYEAVIPHGFDPCQFMIDNRTAYSLHNRLVKDKIMFYCLSVFNDFRKGFNELFNAIQLVKKQIGNKFIVCIRTHTPIYNQLANELKDVVLINQNKASDKEIASEMAASDCYLVSSLAEGFCIPAIEAAYGAGKPIIYPNTSPYNEYLNDSIGYPVSIVYEKNIYVSKGRYYPHSFRLKYWNIEEFASQMIRVIENIKEASKKGYKAYSNRNDWSIYNTYKNFLKFVN